MRRGDVAIEPARQIVTRAGREVSLSAHEYRTPLALMERMGQTVSREQLEVAVYGGSGTIESNTVAVYVHQLRRKLGEGLIVTARRGLPHRNGRYAMKSLRKRLAAALLLTMTLAWFAAFALQHRMVTDEQTGQWDQSLRDAAVQAMTLAPDSLLERARPARAWRSPPRPRRTPIRPACRSGLWLIAGCCSARQTRRTRPSSPTSNPAMPLLTLADRPGASMRSTTPAAASRSRPPNPPRRCGKTMSTA